MAATVRPATEADLTKYYDTLTEVFGRHTPRRDLLTAWLEANDRSLVVADLTGAIAPDEDGIVGFYKLLPLRFEAKDQLENHGMTGSRIPPELVLPPDVEPAALYVGDVFADGRHGFGLKRRLWIEVRRWTCDVYARPVFQKGFDVMENPRLPFRPVGGRARLTMDVVSKWDRSGLRSG